MSENEEAKRNSSITDGNSLVFDNLYRELEFYKKKCEAMEKDLFKSHTNIKKLELSIKKYQDMNSLNGKNVNNTSISFLLPSEFKSLWENFAKDLLLEAFDSLYDDNLFLAYVAHDVISITYEETNIYMKDKVDSVLKLLNINFKQDDKSKQTEYDKFLTRFKSIFQDYFTVIFVFTEEFCLKVKNKLMAEVKSYKISTTDFEGKLEDLQKDLDKKPFQTLIENLFKLCIYMKLHDPVLQHNIQKHSERRLTYIYYNKNDLMNIEGFGTEQTPCVVIVPPPLLRNNFSYMGIKPAVYCLQNSSINEEILSQCERSKQTDRKISSNRELVVIDNKEKEKKVKILHTNTPIKNAIPVNNKNEPKNATGINNINNNQINNSNKINEKKEKYENCDRPLMITKSRKQEEDLKIQLQNIKRSFTGSFISTTTEKEKHPDSPVKLGYYNKYTTSNKNISRSSSINNDENKPNNVNRERDNSNDSHFTSLTNAGNNQSHLTNQNTQNTQNTQNNLITFTKTTRRIVNNNVDNELTPFNTYNTYNTHTMPMRFIPTNFQPQPATSNIGGGFNIVRSKNSKQSFISDSGEKTKREMKDSLEEKINEELKPNFEITQQDQLYLNLNNLNRKNIGTPLLLNKTANASGNVTVNATANKDKKVESRIFNNSPRLDFMNNKDKERESVHADNNNLDDRKYNAPYKKDFGIRTFVEMTPNSNKVINEADIKSKVGRYYNKILNGGPTATNAPSNYNSNASTNNKFDNHVTKDNVVNNYVNNSPKSSYTYSNIAEKGSIKIKATVGSGNNYYNNFPNKLFRK